MAELFAFGVGLANENCQGAMLDCFFPAPVLKPGAELAAMLTSVNATLTAENCRQLAEALGANNDPQSEALARALVVLAEGDRPATVVTLTEDGPISSTAEAYLKLHLLSHRLTLPNSLNLDRIFAHLPNVAWTSEGPVDPAELPGRLLGARRDGRPLDVMSVDKFPKMTNYVIPPGVRIGDASRIRLGAFLGDGTTVMHEGFVNFNAGCIGPNMIEGRVSQGVMLGAHSDLGGSASTMGTLSGGGEIKVSLGEHCLIGANAGTGIPLGDRCTVEAGLYITAATPVRLITNGQDSGFVKARELASASDLLFLRNGKTGAVECRTNQNAITLNEELHAHN